MIEMMSRTPVGTWLAVLLLLSPAALAQTDRWAAYPAMRSVVAISSGAESMWAATSGGVFGYNMETGDIRRFTTVNGLASPDAGAIAVDDARGLVWIGYPSGLLDRLDIASGNIQTYFDISRAEQFTSRGINRIVLEGDSLLIATEFGVVVFDARRGEVRDTYSRFASFGSSTPVFDVLAAPVPGGQRGLWVAGEDGLAWARLDSPNLREPDAWTVDAVLPGSPLSLGYVGGAVYAGTQIDAFMRTAAGAWESVFSNGDRITGFAASGEYLVGMGMFGLLIRHPSGFVCRTNIAGFFAPLSVAASPDGTVWVGERTGGLIAYPPVTSACESEVAPARQIVPDGPFSNLTIDLAIGGDGRVWAGAVAQDNITSVSSFDGTSWTNYTSNVYPEMIRGPARAVHVDAGGTTWVGSEGHGLSQIWPDGSVVTFGPTNSSLQPHIGTASYVWIGDIASDASGRLWVTNFGAARPIHVRQSDGTWTGLTPPPGVAASLRYNRMMIDSFGQFWITVISTTDRTGRGYVVYSPGSDPVSVSDDRAVHVGGRGSGGVGLPDEYVSAIVEDRNGRVWVGTRRGLAVVYSPGSVFGGDPGLALPQWARTADGTSYFLRDLYINDIAVDAANNKWIASTTGVWMINEDGNEVLQHFTMANSPLFSDNVVALAVDPASGVVYFATERGLLSYRSDAIGPSASVQPLTIAPSPFRPSAGHASVLISGLVEETDVRILTVDGRVVATLEARGGSLRWDGRSQVTGDLVPSGIYVVAALARNGQGTAYGKIAVIH
jgi:ligand-binding sensor domain-containing protein